MGWTGLSWGDAPTLYTRQVRASGLGRLLYSRYNTLSMSIDKEIPPPRGSVGFEDLVLALFRAVWNDPGAQLNGRSGQEQYGVDIYGEDRVGGTGLNGVQCKQHGSAKLLRDKDLLKELRAEVEKAKASNLPCGASSSPPRPSAARSSSRKR